MSHEIYRDTSGVDHMFVVGDRDAAWHKLGRRADNAVSWREAMQLAGLDWTVSKRRLAASIPNTLPVEYAQVDAYGIFRDTDNQFLGAVGERYAPIQNRDAFDFVDTLLEADSGCHYDSAGALGQGERIWCSARVPFDFAVADAQDVHQTYLLFSTSHDGQTSATCMLTTVQVVCANTLRAATMGTGEFVRIRHTKTAGERLGQAARLMQGIGATVSKLAEKLNKLQAIAASDELRDKWLERLFPLQVVNGAPSMTARRKAIVGEILTLADIGRNATGTPSVKGTAYGLLCALTEYADYYRSVKGGNGDVAQLQARRAETALFGSGDILKREGMDTLLALAGVANSQGKYATLAS